MYKKVSTDMQFVKREKEVIHFWNEHKIFEKSIEEKEGKPVFTFYDGPPTANGKPHIGHVLTRVIKDIIPRYQTMKGFKVLRKAGWDTHGLPVELEVEKLLGLDGKEQIEAYGLEPFIQKCKESVWKYKGMWEDFSGTVGFWADMNDPYVTYHNEYIESEWWALKQIYDKGLLYKGHKIVPYCSRCGTPLSSHEVAQGYKDLKEQSVIAKFKCLEADNMYFLAWTTTPWTLPSNVALAVNPKETYVKVAYDQSVYILAEALVEKVFAKKEGYTILESFLGSTLEYKAYAPLFDFVNVEGKGFYVTCADYVTLSDGTGIVHIAPAFGEDDAIVGRRYNLPFLQLVNEQGTFKEEVPFWQHTFVKEADPQIIEYLQNELKVFAVLEYEHSYPHCWRCDTPLLYYAKDSWFIEMTKVRDRLVANNKKINWIPKTIGEKRFGDWIENVLDWGLSRDRYWGTPLNIWECECGHRHAIGSIEELKSMSPDCPDTIELHRPFIDEVHLTCVKCSGLMQRVTPVIDCWFNSGAMPFAQWHYPFENKEIFEENFPADFISEAVDQTRGWFYSLLAISTLLFDEPPFKNVIVLGHVQDENGQKMSKSKGNAVDPFDALEKFGADAIRWYFTVNSMPWLPNRFYDDAVVEGQRKFMGTLWNTYAFYVLYAEIDQFDPTKHVLDVATISVMDRWLLSKLNTLVKTVDDHMNNYRLTESARAIQKFVDDLSNWYVRRSRDRFWLKDMPQEKINAYMTLHTTLVTLTKICAPIIPFMTEQIYQNLVSNFDVTAPISIHLCDYPTFDETLINVQLEESMDRVLDIVINGRAARNAANIKNRQPLAQMFVKGVAELEAAYTEIIESELNIKKVSFTEDVSRFTSYSFKPQLKTVGPKYGKVLGQIREILLSIDGNEAMHKLQTQGKLIFDIAGHDVELTEIDLLIETSKKEGFEAVSDQGVTVVLDTTLNEALIEEGFVREVISKIQTMRKEADFDVTDHIILYVANNDVIANLIRNNNETIQSETLAVEIIYGSDENAYTKDWKLNKEDVTLAVQRLLHK